MWPGKKSLLCLCSRDTMLRNLCSLHKQIMDIGGKKLQMVESRLNVINTEIDQTTGIINKASVAVKTAKRSVELLCLFAWFALRWMAYCFTYTKYPISCRAIMLFDDNKCRLAILLIILSGQWACRHVDPYLQACWFKLAMMLIRHAHYRPVVIAKHLSYSPASAAIGLLLMYLTKTLSISCETYNNPK